MSNSQMNEIVQALNTSGIQLLKLFYLVFLCLIPFILGPSPNSRKKFGCMEKWLELKWSELKSEELITQEQI